MEKTCYALDIETDGLIKPLPTAVTLVDDDTVHCAVRGHEDAVADAREIIPAVTDAFHGRALNADLMRYYEEDDGVKLNLGNVSVAQSWEDMAEDVQEMLEVVGDTEPVVTYNGLGYRGGFDIPALDFAYHWVHRESPLRGLLHTDMEDVVNRGYVYNTAASFPSRGGPSKGDMREAAEMFGIEEEAEGLNKAPLADLLNDNLSQTDIQKWADEVGEEVPTTDVGTLDEVYEYLFRDNLPDPFDDSAEAVDAWENGEFADVLVHNISDTLKTMALFEYVDDSAIPFRNYEPERLG